MTSYIGPIGSIIGVKCPSSLSASGGRTSTFSRTLSRQKAFMSKSGPREWSAELSQATTPSQISGLRWLADYGQPPFVWYPPDAVFGNILEPAVAALVSGRHNGLEGPLVEVEPGIWVKSAIPDAAASVSLPYKSGFLDALPIPAGQRITVSAWMTGSAVITVAWRDAAGGLLSSAGSGALGTSGSLVRRSFSATPPAGAVRMTLLLTATQVAGPAVSITDSVTPYSPGKGCRRSVVHGLSESLTLISTQQSMSGYSFTVSEVG